MTIQKDFWDACLSGNDQKVAALLNEQELDVNQPNDETTPFEIACAYGHMAVMELLLKDSCVRVNVNTTGVFERIPFKESGSFGSQEVVELLLKYPHVDVNQHNSRGKTPFQVACRGNLMAIVKLLLEDPRVEVNKQNADGESSFYEVCSNSPLEIVRLLLAHPRIHLEQADIVFYQACKHKDTTLAIALLQDPRVTLNYTEEGQTETGLDLWIKYLSSQSPELVASAEKVLKEAIKHYRISLEKIPEEHRAKFQDIAAAALFATVVFHSDGLLALKPGCAGSARLASRFFEVAGRLPIELQMTLCHRIVGSMKYLIPIKDSELAFLVLVEQLPSDKPAVRGAALTTTVTQALTATSL